MLSMSQMRCSILQRVTNEMFEVTNEMSSVGQPFLRCSTCPNCTSEMFGVYAMTQMRCSRVRGLVSNRQRTVLSQEAPVMSASEEEVGLGLEFGTESDSVSEAEEEESSAGSKTAGKTVRKGGSTGHLDHMGKVAAKAGRQSVDQKARAMDKEAEQEALEAGKLQPRTLEQLNSVDPIVSYGQEFSCREELLVRVGEDCEKKQRFYTCRNSGTGGHATQAGRGMIGHRYVNCVCRDDASCSYSVKGSWFLRTEGDDCTG